MDSLWVLFHLFLLYSQPVGSKVFKSNDVHIIYHTGSYFFQLSKTIWNCEETKRGTLKSGSCIVGPSQDSRPCKESLNHQESFCKLTKNTATEMDEKHHFHTCSRGGWWCVPVKDLHPPNHPSLDLQALQAAMDSKLQGGQKTGGYTRVSILGIPVWVGINPKWCFSSFVNFDMWSRLFWLVVWNIFFPYIENVLIPTDSYFSEGLKPPTRWSRLIKRVW